ncbi:MAG TPA: hypothetical protein VFS43_22920 [Polyangiaceae bacterium]|nr:hypothetical protein [Polyangiaceae bacterium]
MSAAPKLEAGPEGPRPKYLRPEAPPPARPPSGGPLPPEWHRWDAGAGRCDRPDCAATFGPGRCPARHWGIVDASGDRAMLALGGGAPAAPARPGSPAPPPAYEAPRLRGPAELTLSVQEAPAKKGGRRARR